MQNAIALNALSGGVAVKDDTVNIEKLALRTAETSLSVDGAVQHYLSTPVYNLQISSDKLSVPELARLVPALLRQETADHAAHPAKQAGCRAVRRRRRGADVPSALAHGPV